MEGNPHSIIEGMIIGAYAIGAAKGYVYVRTEYPIAVDLIAKRSSRRGPRDFSATTSSARVTASTSASTAAAGRLSAANLRR